MLPPRYPLEFLLFFMTLWRCLDALTGALTDVIEETSPEEILVASGHDWHPDHQAVHVALLRAAARQAFSGVLSSYPVWYWADGPWRTDPGLPIGATWRRLLADPLAARRDGRARLVRTDGFVELKREAFARYRSQTTCFTGEPGWATFAPRWIDPFCGHWEVFFPIADADIAAALDQPCTPVGRSEPATEPAGPFLTRVADHFDDDRAAGAVVGTKATSGASRRGVDREGTISIDNGAARWLSPTCVGYRGMN